MSAMLFPNSELAAQKDHRSGRHSVLIVEIKTRQKHSSAFIDDVNVSLPGK
jgi:hypothetical protein